MDKGKVLLGETYDYMKWLSEKGSTYQVTYNGKIITAPNGWH